MYSGLLYSHPRLQLCTQDTVTSTALPWEPTLDVKLRSQLLKSDQNTSTDAKQRII